MGVAAPVLTMGRAYFRHLLAAVQGSTIGGRRVRMHVYFYWHTHDFRLAYVTRTLIFFLRFFKVFKISQILSLHCFIYLRLEEADYLLFTFILKKRYFSIFHRNYLIIISPDLRPIASLGCN